jgi:hypothetical protein
VNQFLLPWAAYFGLFVSTSNCPCCVQPACPAGAAGMGIVAGFLAAVTNFFRRRRRSRLEADSISNATYPEQRETKLILKSGMLLLFCAFALYACVYTAQHQAELHKRVAIEVRKRGVSINSLVGEALSKVIDENPQPQA